jgi:hypothetical protein
MPLRLVIAVAAASALALAPSAGAVWNGTTASAEVPWAVKVTASVNGKTLSCTGSIVSRHFVLTAAHCLAAGATMQIRADLPAGSTAATASVAWSGGWTCNAGGTDLALLQTGLDLSTVAQRPLPLAPSAAVEASFAGKPVTYFGWGDTGDESQVTWVPITNGCGGYTPSSVVLATAVQKTRDGAYILNPPCAFDNIAGQICFTKVGDLSRIGAGDSGGPWVVWEGGSWVEIGVMHATFDHVGGEEDAESVASARDAILAQVNGEILHPASETIVRDAAGGSEWLVGTDGFRRSIPTAADSNCFQTLHGNPVVIASLFDIQTLPELVGAQATCTATSLSEGTFVTYQGATYRIVGHAPVFVSTWSAVDGTHATTALSDADWKTLARYPRDSTFVTAGSDTYRIAGGAPIYVSSWSAVGGVQPAVAIDPFAIDHAGESAALDHLRVLPVDGTRLTVSGGSVYEVSSGVAVLLSGASAAGATRVDQAAIDRAGSGGVWNHLQAPPPPPIAPAPSPSGGGGSGGGGGSSGVAPDLHVEISPGASTAPAVGGELDYAITVSSKNVGGSSAVRLDVMLPAGYRVTRVDRDRGSGCTGTAPALTCDVAWINPAASTHVWIFGTVGQAGDQTLTATATSLLESELDPGDNALTVTLKAVAAPPRPTPISTTPSTPLPRTLRPPQLTGTAQVGSVVRIASARWSATPTSIRYRWQLCAAGRCAAIVGATDKALKVSQRFSGRSIRAVVIAQFGATRVTSTSARVGVRRKA